MDLFQQLTANTTLLTPNRRLSAALSKQHQKLQIDQQKTCWESPDILPMPSWLERLWRESIAREISSTPFLLNANQEQVIWEHILRNSPESENLLQVSHTAELAKAAWGILKQWQVDIDNSAFTHTQDHAAFQNWAQQFRQLCNQQNWLDQHSLTDKIISKISAGTIVPPSKIILMGFTEISPQHQHLLSVCKEHGSEITHYEPTPSQPSAQRISLNDAEEEIRTMARWAKSLYDTSSTTKIGCIIPNLEDKRDQVIQIFSNVFSEKNSYTLDYTELPFNISAGKCLSAYPIIHTALQLLNLHSSNISQSVFSTILRSPFLGEAEQERLRRANFDSRLRNSNVIQLSLKKLLSEQEEKFQLSTSCPALAKRLKNYFEIIDNKKKLPISEWVAVFIESLKLLGWPGERSLNSTEYQIIQNCWLPLLSQYAGFNDILGPQNYSTALHFLMRLAGSTVFQPQSPEAPIQILGMLEAAELSFNYLWVSGLDDSVWPSPAKPNPFIPQRLQRSLKMPNATPERELLYCKKLTQQLQRSASHVIFSNAMHTDKAELRPSALIKNIDEITLDQLSLSEFTSSAEQVFQTQQIETLCDEQAPSIVSQSDIRGGASIFKLQSACPFKAFAELRLHAAKIETPTLGLRPQDRGNIVHKALEHIWNELNDLDTLLALNENDLQQLIHKHAKNAIKSVNRENTDNTRYISLELTRLEKILHEWMQLEKSRPHFKVIMREEERTATIGNIFVKLRVDRIDELENGMKLIIDYKTGKNNQIKNWFDDRPEEPQLPLYCIIDPVNIAGISFAEIHPTSMKIKGVSKTDLHITGINLLTDSRYSTAASWDDQIKTWQSTLEKIGNDFYQGHAEVDPKNSDETCQYCNLQALCRIYEI